MLSGVFVILFFSLLIYGLTNLLVNGMGPFDIIDKFRNLMGKISKEFGHMLDCMMCTSTNVALIISMIDLFLVRNYSFTPSNFLFDGNIGMWFLILPFDAVIGSGITWAIHKMVAFFETYEQNE